MLYYLKYDTTGLTPFCFTGPEISPFLNYCGILSRTTKNVYVPKWVLNMVLSTHKLKTAGIRGELTEFHNETKRIENCVMTR